MLMTRHQSFDRWKGIVRKQLEIRYELDIEMFQDAYSLQDAYDAGKETRLVVEELALIIT